MGMVGVDKIGEIRRAYFEQDRSIKEIVRTLSVSRATVRKVIRSHKTITLQGLPLTVKAAHMKLSHSRMPFVRVYFRETQELVFDAHDKAFLFYGGVCRRGIYDNMKTAVEAIFVGKARRYNRRFLQMCSHHLIEPVACTPASGWEKGQVENQVGNLRDQMFRPKPRVKSLTELNAWLEDQCIAYARRSKHPEI